MPDVIAWRGSRPFPKPACGRDRSHWLLVEWLAFSRVQARQSHIADRRLLLLAFVTKIAALPAHEAHLPRMSKHGQ